MCIWYESPGVNKRSCKLAEAPWAKRQSRSISPNLIPTKSFPVCDWQSGEGFDWPIVSKFHFVLRHVNEPLVKCWPYNMSKRTITPYRPS
ncbi:hypothetical protein CICLE_v10013216mg [Citrus x clementina]|uniref:Uncharacterized protein n=2 Tax=Citrus TaxID=2706 RepID=A0A067DWX2_CITSI|nr:hypothetical protein CICLE_v10013216mg [Citrus x clementina]KDO47489.1 hypothetical protein CISIN_1g043328mg [Citrus sinensis]